ncbi:hypothetical protein AOX55_00005947 (plasmid) [Sinorhizobium fredii CCBAU 25509]|nr:hypothetical protein AOX55_00005947 [Sinorhizobium fredii CCBAU 25509]
MVEQQRNAIVIQDSGGLARLAEFDSSYLHADAPPQPVTPRSVAGIRS